MSCCRSVATRPWPSGFSHGCWRRVPKCRARSSPTSCAATRRAKAEIPKLANVKHVFVKASARVNNRTAVPRIAISLRVNASGGCVASATRNARQLSRRASDPFASTSRSSDIYCVHHAIANSSPHALLRGIASPGYPRSVRFLSQRCALAAIASSTRQRDNAVPVGSWSRRWRPTDKRATRRVEDLVSEGRIGACDRTRQHECPDRLTERCNGIATGLFRRRAFAGDHGCKPVEIRREAARVRHTRREICDAKGLTRYLNELA